MEVSERGRVRLRHDPCTDDSNPLLLAHATSTSVAGLCPCNQSADCMRAPLTKGGSFLLGRGSSLLVVAGRPPCSRRRQRWSQTTRNGSRNSKETLVRASCRRTRLAEEDLTMTRDEDILHRFAVGAPSASATVISSSSGRPRPIIERRSRRGSGSFLFSRSRSLSSATDRCYQAAPQGYSGVPEPAITELLRPVRLDERMSRCR